MRDEREGPGPGPSRRRFLQVAGLAAAGMGSLGVRPHEAGAVGRMRRQVGPPVGEPEADCECGAEPALALQAAALVAGGYFGLANGPAGPRLFSLDIDAANGVTLGAAVDVNVPAGFVVGSLGVAAGRLILTGGTPFVWDAFQADDDIAGVVRDEMPDVPLGIPTSGTRRIEVTGLRPVAFHVDPPDAQPLSLPEMPRRLFAMATEVDETDRGALVLMVEHSDQLTESWYADAVDVLEERARGWKVHATGRALGESGPNHLAVIGDEVVVLLKTSRGVTVVRPGRRVKAQAFPPGGRVLHAFSGEGGLTVLAADRAGGSRMWSEAADGWTDRGPVALDGDEVVAAVKVAGTTGQSVLLGRVAARLVDESSAFAGQQGGR
jgi:hypothetical protein